MDMDTKERGSAIGSQIARMLIPYSFSPFHWSPRLTGQNAPAFYRSLERPSTARFGKVDYHGSGCQKGFGAIAYALCASSAALRCFRMCHKQRDRVSATAV